MAERPPGGSGRPASACEEIEERRLAASGEKGGGRRPSGRRVTTGGKELGDDDLERRLWIRPPPFTPLPPSILHPSMSSMACREAPRPVTEWLPHGEASDTDDDVLADGDGSAEGGVLLGDGGGELGVEVVDVGAGHAEGRGARRGRSRHGESTRLPPHLHPWRPWRPRSRLPPQAALPLVVGSRN